jgi:uncharacterized membrane protein YoaK (UPF0700 family)
LVGAILGAGLTSFIGAKAVWITVILLVCSVVLLSINEHKNKIYNERKNKTYAVEMEIQ